MTKLEWCKANAPEALKVLSDVELMEMMNSSYERFCSEKEIDENSMESVEYDKNVINNHLDYMVLELVREFGNNLAFKGGYMLTKLMESSARQTTDIDFSIASAEIYEDIKLVLERIGEHFLQEGVVDMYKVKDVIQPRMSGGADFYKNGVKVFGVDVGWHNISYGTTLVKTDIATVTAFKIERMVADKVTAILSKKRFRRPKDLYDLFCILQLFDLDSRLVLDYINERTEGKGVDWQNHPFNDIVLREYAKAYNSLNVVSIYRDERPMAKPDFTACMDVFNKVVEVLKYPTPYTKWDHNKQTFVLG